MHLQYIKLARNALQNINGCIYKGTLCTIQIPNCLANPRCGNFCPCVFSYHAMQSKNILNSDIQTWNINKLLNICRLNGTYLWYITVFLLYAAASYSATL